jgi:hypothetical protein
MKKHIFLTITGALVLMGLLCPEPATAQGREFATAGTTELAGSISFSSITPVSHGESGDATTVFSFGPEIGYFVTDGFEIGFNPGVSLLPGMSVVTPTGGDGMTVLQLFAFPAYTFHIEGSSSHPFIQIPFGYTSTSSGNNTQSGFSWGIKGGVKVVATSHLLLTVYGEYLAISLAPEGVTERYGMNYLSFGVSVGGFF